MERQVYLNWGMPKPPVVLPRWGPEPKSTNAGGGETVWSIDSGDETRE